MFASITVQHSLCDYSKRLGSPKGNRERNIPLSIDVYAVLFRRKENKGHVFVDLNGKPFNSKRINRRLANVCEKAGLRRIG